MVVSTGISSISRTSYLQAGVIKKPASKRTPVAFIKLRIIFSSVKNFSQNATFSSKDIWDKKKQPSNLRKAAYQTSFPAKV
jgi:hypothetical protein